jgi:hypothetical protein
VARQVARPGSSARAGRGDRAVARSSTPAAGTRDGSSRTPVSHSLRARRRQRGVGSIDRGAQAPAVLVSAGGWAISQEPAGRPPTARRCRRPGRRSPAEPVEERASGRGGCPAQPVAGGGAGRCGS